jgi:hypothetical protein
VGFEPRLERLQLKYANHWPLEYVIYKWKMSCIIRNLKILIWLITQISVWLFFFNTHTIAKNHKELHGFYTKLLGFHTNLCDTYYLLEMCANRLRALQTRKTQQLDLKIKLSIKYLLKMLLKHQNVSLK